MKSVKPAIGVVPKPYPEHLPPGCVWCDSLGGLTRIYPPRAIVDAEMAANPEMTRYEAINRVADRYTPAEIEQRVCDVRHG